MSERRLTKRNDDDEERSLVQWGGYDEEAVEEHERELEEGAGNEFDKLEVGRNHRRILPPPKGSGWGKNGSDSPILVVWEHVINVPGADRPLRFSCPKKMKGEPCFACEQSVKMKRSAIPADRDMGFNLRPRRASYLQWFDPEEDDPEIKVYNAGKTISEALVDLRQEKGDFSHPTRGYELIVKRKGTGRNDTKYKVIAGDELPLSEFDFKPTDLFDLEDYISVPSVEEQEEMVEEIQELLQGRKRRRRDDDDDDGRGRSRRSRRSRDDDDDEDDDDRSSRRSRRRSRGGDDEDSGSSRRRGRRSGVRSYDPDDDDGTETIDAEYTESGKDEEEEKPKRRRGGGRRRRRS